MNFITEVTWVDSRVIQALIEAGLLYVDDEGIHAVKEGVYTI